MTQVRRHFLNQMENYNTFCPTRTCDFQFWDYATVNVFSKIVVIVFLDRNYYVRGNWKSKLCFKYVLYFYVKISRQWLLFAIFSNVELMWFNKKNLSSFCHLLWNLNLLVKISVGHESSRKFGIRKVREQILDYNSVKLFFK